MYVAVCGSVFMYMHISKFPTINVQKKLYSKAMKKGQHCMLLIN